MKSGGHRKSWGGHFSWLSPLEGAKGGTPKNYLIVFFAKSLQINISLKSEKNHVFYAKYFIIIVSARGEGASEAPPV